MEFSFLPNARILIFSSEFGNIVNSNILFRVWGGQYVSFTLILRLPIDVRYIYSDFQSISCTIMPPKRQAIGLSMPEARKQNALRVLETDDQWEARLETEHCMLI